MKFQCETASLTPIERIDQRRQIASDRRYLGGKSGLSPVRPQKPTWQLPCFTCTKLFDIVQGQSVDGFRERRAMSILLSGRDIISVNAKSISLYTFHLNTQDYTSGLSMFRPVPKPSHLIVAADSIHGRWYHCAPSRTSPCEPCDCDVGSFKDTLAEFRVLKIAGVGVKYASDTLLAWKGQHKPRANERKERENSDSQSCALRWIGVSTTQTHQLSF